MDDPTTTAPTSTPTSGLKAERLELLAESLATMVDDVDLEAMIEPTSTWRTMIKVARLARIDLVDLVRTEVLRSIRSLSSAAASHPERAAATAEWLALALAWLRGATDDPPPTFELELPRRAK